MNDAPDESRSVVCGSCGAQVDEQPGALLEERSPCPSCGSLARKVSIHLQAEIKLRSSLQLKAKTPGERRPFVEQRVGASFFRKAGRWHIIEQLVDRRGNRYKKKIVDEETGEVLRDDDGKLTDHQGFGDAKKPE